MKQLFQGGTIVSPGGCRKADILVEGGKIAAVGKGFPAEGAEVTDVKGKYLFPGFIDAHTHMDLEVSGTVTADGFETGTKAELSGGTTCIVDFATQNKGESLAYALQHWHEKADGKSSCDYAFHLALSDWNEDISKELERVREAGICSFKLYTIYDAMVVDDKAIYEILTRLKELGGIAGIHCENRGIIDARLAMLLQQKKNRRSVADYPSTRPALAEAEAVSRVLKIAALVDTPVIIVHLSSREGLAEVMRARERGQKVFVETCPQYLLLDESRYAQDDDLARRYMIAPPLRREEDQKVLWSALAKGYIQTICTDHCSFTTQQKEMGKDDFAKTPCGMPGAEERPALIYHYGVRSGKITLTQMCAYLSENPARLYHLFPQKGVLAAGSDADIVVWNPEMEWVLSAETQQSASDYCPFEGTRLTGRAEQVYLRGVLAAEQGVIRREREGRYITRKD